MDFQSWRITLRYGHSGPDQSVHRSQGRPQV